MKNQKINVYELVTNRIIEQLNNGIIPWHKPWKVSGIAIKGAHGLRSVAFNRISRTAYSPLNQMILSRAGEYATFKQWESLGGTIKKGAKAETVVFWATESTKKDKDEDGNEIIKQIIFEHPILRYYHVFHINDVDGVKSLEAKALEDGNAETFDCIETAENIINEYSEREQMPIYYGGNNAFYSPRLDYVQVPARFQFEKNAGEFYSTIFHELTHSTGAKKRLDRLTNGEESRFGKTEYSKEELTAELGAAGILSILGIETESTFTNSTAYIQGWLKVLKNDNRLIVSASTKAEKAIKYIFNGKETETAKAVS